MAEWSKATVLKAVDGNIQGFESLWRLKRKPKEKRPAPGPKAKPNPKPPNGLTAGGGGQRGRRTPEGGDQKGKASIRRAAPEASIRRRAPEGEHKKAETRSAKPRKESQKRKERPEKGKEGGNELSFGRALHLH